MHTCLPLLAVLAWLEPEGFSVQGSRRGSNHIADYDGVSMDREKLLSV
jgi:hypothetical protein